MKVFGKDPASVTLLAAIEWLREVFKSKEFAQCPVCKQTVKHYVRPLNSGMMRGLIKFYNMMPSGWTVLPDVDRREYAKLEFEKTRFWGLVERRGTRAVREWTITELGHEFLKGEATVTKRAHVFDDNCFKRSGPQVNIRQALGEKFDLEKLLHARRSEGSR